MNEVAESSKRILIIDDEMDMRFFLTTLVKTAGFDPIVARNGREGLDKAKSTCPDLILLDVMMPEKGGALVYRQLRTDDTFRSVPVIILSAVSKSAFHHYINMLNSEGAKKIPMPDGYIEKPPEADYVLDKIQSLLPAS